MRSYLLILLALLVLLSTIECDGIVKRENLSSVRSGVGGIRVGDRFYFPGGFEFNDYIPTNIVDIYNITSQEWEEPIYLDEPRGWISTAVIGQNIYFIGGARYLLSCSHLYDTQTHRYKPIGCGPTVRTPQQLSNHNSTVTVLGSFSADFYNINSSTWYYLPTLTSWMQRIGGGASMVHENLIIGIGGVTTTTLEPVYDAWIFDTETNNLTLFTNVMSAQLQFHGAPTFRVAHGKLVILVDDRYFVHQFGTSVWSETFMASTNEAAILPDIVFVFNTSGYSWSNDLVSWTFSNMDPTEKILVFETQFVLCQHGLLRIYEAGQWTQKTMTGSVALAVRWNHLYAVMSSTTRLGFYNSQSKAFENSAFYFEAAVSMVPLDQDTLTIFQSGGEARVYYYASDGLAIGTRPPNMQGEFAIGSDIIDLKNNLVWIGLTNTTSVRQTGFLYKASSDGTTVFVNPPIRDYFYMNVYNYVTREWQPKILLNVTIGLGMSFAPVAVLNDTLVLTRKNVVLRYNTTSGQSFVESLSVYLPIFPIVTPVPVIANIGHFPGYAPSTIITVSALTTAVRDDLNLVAATLQFVTSEDNVIYIATNSTTVYTFDIARLSFDTLLLPVKQEKLAIAISNNVLVVVGSGNVYAMKLDDLTRWYVVPLTYDFVPTIAEGLDNGTIMIAGGKHPSLLFSTDEILFINASAVIEQGAVVATPEPEPPVVVVPVMSEETLGGNQELSMEILIVVIVVPVAVVVAGATALIVVLLKKKSDKKRKGGNISSLGLESRFGAWFTPFNQITFGEQLGQGSSGQVFKGTWKSTTVALKVSMTQANTTVISELELMMQLRPHPNVVQLLGFSVHPETDSIILIIEFCEGGSLDTKLYDDQDDISMKEKVQWLLGIAKGLNHLHSNNIVHRDVAARNVLLHRSEPKLTDFGMSRLIDENTQRGTTKSELGPIRWMSPESLKNKEYSAKSDIWSFGVLMYEVIARQEPHIDKDPIEIGRLIRDSGLTPVIPSTCHPQLAEIMRQCWQMSPQSRPKIESIIESLEEIQID